jgi:chromosomal replication initiation ATPase DnaA
MKLKRMQDFPAELELIRREVAIGYGVGNDFHVNRSRVAGTVKARHVFIFLAREFYKLSYPELAMYCDRDHSSMIHAYNRVTNDRMFNRTFDLEVKQLEKVCEIITSGYHANGAVQVIFGKKDIKQGQFENQGFL